jgi:hypothetical protein
MRFIITSSLLLIWFALGTGTGWLLHDKTSQVQHDITDKLNVINPLVEVLKP